MDDVRRPGQGASVRSAPPTMAQDQAVIGWLAMRPALSVLTRDLLIDALDLLAAVGAAARRHRRTGQ